MTSAAICRSAWITGIVAVVLAWAPPAHAEVKKIGADLNGQSLILRVNPDIARALRDEERAVFKDLKQSLGREIAVRPDTQLHHEQFDLMAVG